LDYLHLNKDVLVQQFSLVFTGSLTYFPNRDAMEWFSHDILPLVAKNVPQVKLRILGDPGNFSTIQSPVATLIEFAGVLRDVRPELWRSWATIVPLRHGSGTRLKILESMALGIPVISTSKGAEGLVVTHEENILIADEPVEFARQVLRLLRDVQLRQRLAANARVLVERQYNWRIIGAQFDRFIEQTVAARKDCRC
jgi:glycosyltransferase involved in cell wall biosynthesis